MNSVQQIRNLHKIFPLLILQVIEKRHERRQDKTPYLSRGNEKAEFIPINEHFEANFNAVLASAIVFQQPVSKTSGINCIYLMFHLIGCF